MFAAIARTWGLVAAAIVASAAVLGALQQIWVRLIRPSIRLVTLVEVVAKEFQPNGGSSIVDRVKRVDEKTGEIIDRMVEVESKAEGVAARADRLNDAVGHLEAHALQFTAFEKYARGRIHDILNATQKVFLAMHIKGIEIPIADPPFPGDDPGLVPDEFPRKED